ncbi:hypothetical protein B0F90DRAFT_1151547 [Multifurca ochricompacta]|uniref:C2H2-type domain-containing protein n=1 Tax=Multifurca ochricompacta TaxID=376703 RepID=A0AAD4LZ74_9AGAM|nr:hypothetical protein B0F90DRAFT_1151547 [Multifurca ochricompacta]
MDLSSPACSECVLDCNDAACKDGNCESTCEDPNTCPLPGLNLAACDVLHHKDLPCRQDRCSVACESTCDDPENCSLANITDQASIPCPQLTADQTCPHHTHFTDWNTTLEAFLCSCGDAFPLRDGVVSESHVFPRDHYIAHSPPLSAIPSLSDSNSLSSAFSTPLQQAEFAHSLYTPQPPEAIAPTEHTCLWNNCRSHFSSLTELVSHVNLSHLSVYLSESPGPFSAPSSYLRLSSEALEISCQWDNCQEYPSTSINSECDHAHNLLTGHLLHDHLGLQGACGDHNLLANAAMADAVLPISGPIQEHDVGMRCEPQDMGPQHYKQGVVSSSGSAKQDDANKWHDKHERSLTAEAKTLSCVPDGSERCCWRGCELSFASVDDLMSHLTTEHVGSGKNHYECFWSGCERSGKNGFTSKQKVCRHLQMHTGHKPFQCKLCKQNFSEAATLQQHMRRHTQEKPYLCDVPGCGKAFAIAGALTIHRRTHMGLKPFKCKYCERAFSESSNLSKHMRTHTGVRPYVCEEPGCGKAFARPDQFTRHQAVHSKRPRAAINEILQDPRASSSDSQ